jgi:hypothetical protein
LAGGDRVGSRQELILIDTNIFEILCSTMVTWDNEHFKDKLAGKVLKPDEFLAEVACDRYLTTINTPGNISSL